MESTPTSDGVRAQRLYFQEKDDKDQRKTQAQTLRLNGSSSTVALPSVGLDNRLGSSICQESEN